MKCMYENINITSCPGEIQSRTNENPSGRVSCFLSFEKTD